MISQSAVARGTAYALEAGKPLNNTDNLPQRIAVVAEMTDANALVTPFVPVQITSRSQAAILFGWGSPMDIICRILFPSDGGGGVSGIPVWAYPVKSDTAAAQVFTITVTGTAAANETHTALIGGREFLEGGTYQYNIVKLDTPTQIATKIKNAINAVLGCPFSATSLAGVVTLTARWSGATSTQLTLHMLTGLNAAVVTYAIAAATVGSGNFNFATATGLFDTNWNTIIINSCDITNTANNAIMTGYNGNADLKTGQWSPMVFQPGLYFTGTTLDSTASSADTVITATQKNEMTIATCPAPLSLGLSMEAAANYAVAFANVANNTPNGDVETMALPDMPRVYADITGSPQQSSSWNLRQALVLLGMSTVIYNNGRYYIQDFITTYAPTGVVRPAWRWCRDVNIDENVRYKFTNLQASVIGNKQIAADDDVVNLPNVVKPKDVRGALVNFAVSLVAQGLCTDAKKAIKTISVVINAGNINRFDISFGYNRSGVVRIVDTLATANP